MYSFIISIIVLILGYTVYGKIAERIFGVDKNRPTPAIANPDGVDYVPLPWWRVFLIQFLNIAGLGPIFGAHLWALCSVLHRFCGLCSELFLQVEYTIIFRQ